MWIFLTILSFLLILGLSLIIDGFFDEKDKYGIHILEIDKELSDDNDHRDLVLMLSGIISVIILGLLSILFLISYDKSLEKLVISFSQSVFNKSAYAISLGFFLFIMLGCCCFATVTFLRLIKNIFKSTKKIRNTKLKYTSIIIAICFGWLACLNAVAAFAVIEYTYMGVSKQCYQNHTKII